MAAEKKSDKLFGFNHNIKHNGKIFHVQTEDSGVANPHIITHLFVGGNILATKKTSYADIVSAGNLQEIVRELMQEQHKAMMRNLVTGVYEGMDSSKARAAELASREQPGLPPRPSSPEQVPAPVPVAAPAAAAARSISQAPTQPAMPAVAAAAPVRPALAPAPTQPAMPAVAAAVPPRPVRAPTPPPRPAVPPPLPAVVQPARREPEPREAVGAQGESEVPPEVLAARRMVDRPTPKDTSGPTIFGENLISERSLDEVILGYLSGDGEESP